ncbi:bucentaur or craniofacial development-domain-containing protein [Sphaerosporella brunnea]|uniref:SWR1-complex protein 5 n=1 Tax=Sphaerosporella brunnea TaxID=1250544 RepID=A0A5J5EF28_9PEZI|nr:bucentaur or craniofacial development-domain-containing protein [Sphaerosporella brunnea]
MPPSKSTAPAGPAASLLDSDYDSAEDSDFDPSTVAGGDDNDDASSSDSDSDPAASPKPARKRKRADSIDSVPVEPLIKTRSQRAAEQREKSGGVASGKVTTDVDALWAAMNSPAAATATAAAAPSDPRRSSSSTISSSDEKQKEEATAETGEKMVTIKHTYEFAGETITEEKLVPASSETARVYFSGSSSASPAPSADGKPARRPPPKKRASAFDAAAAARSKAAQPAKINTLEKSRLDWAGFVDKEGIGDDLKKWNKGDKGYLDRQAFLGRVEENKERQLKEARRK